MVKIEGFRKYDFEIFNLKLKIEFEKLKVTSAEIKAAVVTFLAL